MSEEVTRLINKLNDLHIRRRRIDEEEEDTLARLQRELRDTSNREAPPAVAAVVEDPDPHLFAVGDHVHIENRIRHVALFANPADRAAIVTRVQPHRIEITTYNGYSTWRAPNNLRHLSEREQNNIRRRYL